MGDQTIKIYNPMTTGTAVPAKLAISKYLQNIVQKFLVHNVYTFHLYTKSIILSNS